MKIADLNKTEGRTFPARRLTKNIVGGSSSIQAENFSLGLVTLEPNGGQVPWHNHEQEEIYMILEGTGEICVGTERQQIIGGQTVYIPSNEFHQLTNIGDEPLKFVYCYGPAGDVAHWKQELKGTLPRAGEDVPPLPEGARPQCTEPAEEYK
ncbi:dimethylsulfonioproprionate lyase family protein [Halalkalibaculum sp. DA3122]|uniref:dimethylsulfonioproprionate lyase family protein n=1 Tax=unclassified Halalkalibaculum TaxID=2964617 RepID=UPI003754E602